MYICVPAYVVYICTSGIGKIHKLVYSFLANAFWPWQLQHHPKVRLARWNCGGGTPDVCTVDTGKFWYSQVHITFSDKMWHSQHSAERQWGAGTGWIAWTLERNETLQSMSIAFQVTPCEVIRDSLSKKHHIRLVVEVNQCVSKVLTACSKTCKRLLQSRPVYYVRLLRTLSVFNELLIFATHAHWTSAPQPAAPPMQWAIFASVALALPRSNRIIR